MMLENRKIMYLKKNIDFIKKGLSKFRLDGIIEPVDESLLR